VTGDTFDRSAQKLQVKKPSLLILTEVPPADSELKACSARWRVGGELLKEVTDNLNNLVLF
jgi:hypothetical protein